MTKELSPMLIEELRELVPAAFSHRPAPDRTERYKLVNTANVIDLLAERGFVVTQASQDRPTRRDPKFVRHMLRFTHEDKLNPQVLGEAVPQILFWNSHNGRTMARFTSGFFRLVCLNGMVIGQNTNVFQLRHSGDEMPKQIAGALDLAAESLEAGQRRIEHWEQVQLSDRQVVNFAEAAARLRFGKEKANGYDTQQFLNTRRDEDAGNNLWHVFNRVQENLMHGGAEGRNANGRRIRSRAITGITNDLLFNRELWSMADKLAA